jgi:hypothetical protein
LAKKPWVAEGVVALCVFGAGIVAWQSQLIHFQNVSPHSRLESSPIHAEQRPIVSPMPREMPTKEAKIRFLFEQRNWTGVLTLIEDEVRMGLSKPGYESYVAWLKRQRSIVRTAQAWSFLSQQNCSSAMTILEEIPESERPDAAFKGMGYCKFLTRDWADAEAFLTRYLKTQAHDHESIQMLARVKEAMGDFDEAIALTESLANIEDEKAADVELEPLRKTLVAKQNESLNQLIRQGAFFTLHYQPAVQPDYLDQVAETLEKTAAKLNSVYGIEYPEKSVDIFFHDAAKFGEITHGPEWAAGVYDGQIRLPIDEAEPFNESVARAIRHEITHALLSEMVGRRNLPTWFQEGFAQLAECEDLCTQYDYAATTQRFMPVGKFEGSFLDLPVREAQVAYKQSLYMVLLLIHYQPNANIRQMFTLMPGLENLSSQELIALSSWSFALLHQSAKGTWEKQISLKTIRPQH